MLSDEEKKAINDLNFIIVTDIYDNEVSIDKTKIINEYNESVGVVLNLIKKQSKEIEELNKENTRQHELIGNIHKKWKDKIKAKIEEYEEKIKKIKEKCVWEEPYDTEKYVRYTNYIYALQSLLEKE